MRFDLTSPCGNCPFRSDRGHFGLYPERVRGILGGGHGREHWPAASFPCHKTIDYGDGPEIGPHAQQCAGVMIILHREGRPNDAMQIAERLGLFDPTKLDLNAPVYRSTDDAIAGIPHEGDKK
jgi:hypothetical protein